VAATGAGSASIVLAALAFGDDTALIMGGTGVPVPPQSYLDRINDHYLHCDDCTLQGLSTPEGVYPASGVHSLPLDTSVTQGVAALDDALSEHLADGDDVTVAGYSQSATIASQEMQHLLDGSAGIDPDPDQLSFALIGNPSNPNGGLLERLDFPPGSDPSIPSLGITFDGAAPDTEYPTTEYTSEYDGFADFPLYPLNFLADANAVLGIIFVHTRMPDFTSEQLDDAVQVPTSDGDDGDSTYYMIPTEDLPLLDPLRSIPGLGPVVADLIQPGLEPLVNLGYGDPDYGWVN
jgi:hypothetical protein